MSTGNLTINLKGIANNWSALDRMSSENVETAAVVVIWSRLAAF